MFGNDNVSHVKMNVPRLVLTVEKHILKVHQFFINRITHLKQMFNTFW